MSKTFWADVINTIAFLINRGPSVPLGFRIPEKAWNGKKVNLSYLKMFGCLSYVHIDGFAINKLDLKSKKCYFIGYGDIVSAIVSGMLMQRRLFGAGMLSSTKRQCIRIS